MIAAVWSVVERIGGVVGIVLAGLLAVYIFPGSPLQKIIDSWIKRRVSHHFDKELDVHRHQLALEAERVRTEHQRLLHNAAIVAQKKHEIYREMFHLIHDGMGAVVHLYGLTHEPDYNAWSLADLELYMTESRFPGKIKDVVLKQWDNDRKWALEQLRTTTRHGKIEEAEVALAKAWNYFVGNALYLPDAIAAKVREAREPLERILAFAKSPAPGTGDLTGWAQTASDRVEELKRLLRAELRVIDEGGDDRDRKP